MVPKIQSAVIVDLNHSNPDQPLQRLALFTEDGDPFVPGSSDGVELFEAFGHSFPAGGGAIDYFENGMAAVAAKMLSPTLFRNMCLGGQVMAYPYIGGSGDGGYNWILQNVLRHKMGDAQNRWLPGSQVVMAATGENDLSLIGASDLVPFKTAYRAALSRFCACTVDEYGSAAWTQSGSGWTTLDGAYWGSGPGFTYTTTVGDYREFHLPATYPGGRVIGFDMWINYLATSSVIGVKIDGVDQADVVLDGAAMTIAGVFNVHALRLNTPAASIAALEAAGAHTIRLTLKAGGSGTPTLAPNCGFVEADPEDGPFFAVPMKWRPQTYDLWGGLAFPLTDIAVTALDAAKSAVHAEFDQPFTEIDMSDIPRTSEYWGDDTSHPGTVTHKIAALRVATAAAEALTDRMRERFAHVAANGLIWWKIGREGGPAGEHGWHQFDTASPPATDHGAIAYDSLNHKVLCRGLLAGGTVDASGSGSMFTFPVGLRPRSLLREFPVSSNTAFGMIRILTGGIACAYVGNNAYMSLDGIEFEPEV